MIDTEKNLAEGRVMFGRRVIYSDVPAVTAENVVNVVLKAMETHALNRSEIDYLWKYRKGDQPILHRIKEVRPEICNKVVENRADQIVNFWVGWIYGEPVQYTSPSGDESVSEAVQELNRLMAAEDKDSLDRELGEWQMVCGTSYRMVLPDSRGEEDDAPYEMFVLDPRNAFVVYSTEIGNRPLMGVKYNVSEDGLTTCSVYTKDMYYLIQNGLLISAKPHSLGDVPIYEYPANLPRLGAFEIVLTLLDQLNNLASNRMDGVEQIVQAFIKFINCEISKEEYEQFLALGAIKVKSTDGQHADVDVVTTELNQDQTQTLKTDLYNSILTITGMPGRNGEGGSYSDTGKSVELRNGWVDASSRAKSIEQMFKRSEKRMLRMVLRICREAIDGFDLRIRDIDIKFTRRNYEDIQSKSQVLISMLQQPKVHPLLAFEHSGMFTDPETAYAMSMKYYEEQMEKWEPVTDEDVSEDG